MALEALAQEYWDEGLKADPVGATALGERAYDHLMPDESAAAREARIRQLHGQRQRVEAVDPAGLGPEDALTRGELLGAIGRELDHLEVDLEAWNVNHMWGPQLQLMQLPDFQPLRDEPEVHGYLARVGAMPAWLDGRTERMREAYLADKVASVRPVERVISQVEGILARPATEWPLGKHLDAPIEGVDDEVRAEARAELERTLEEDLRPALGRYLAALRDEVLPRTRGEDQPGLMHVPGGAEAYRRLARAHTSLDLSPEEIHEIGLEEVARIIDAIQDLGERVFGTRDHAAIQARLREDAALHYAEPGAIVADAEAAIARAEARLPEVFGLRPAERCAVRPIPPDEAPSSTIGYYRGPAPDGSRPGRYYVNTYAPETRRRFETEVLAFHEAVPGHHLQISVAQKLAALPEFRRHGGVTAYVEGWALYAEGLAEDLGLYSGDLDRLGAHYFDVKRACRLVVDTGLHALGWSRQQGIDFMVENSLMAGRSVEVEVDRFTVMPGQALSYKLGQLEILSLRRRAEEQLGEAFDLRGFHDVVLGAGAVSLPVLIERVRAWSERVAV